MERAAGAKIANYVSFQLGWFACILGAAAGYPWVGPAAAAVLLAIHLSLAKRRTTEAALIGLAAVIGYVADSLLVLGGQLDFPEQARLGGPSTLWMVALWANFVSTFNSSMSWMLGRYGAGALLGLIGGPLAYLAGEKLGAAVLPQAEISLAFVGLEWAAATPLLLWITGRLNGMAAIGSETGEATS